MTDVAPHDECIVCEEELSRPSQAMLIPHSRPIGARVCSDACLERALRRYDRTGRVDGQLDSGASPTALSAVGARRDVDMW